MAKVKLRKNDLVEIIAGKNKSNKNKGRLKRGKILSIDYKSERVLVDGQNITKKMQKPRRQGEKGTIIESEAPVHISNVMFICKGCGPTRLGFSGEKRSKVRICRKCKEEV